MLIGQPVPAEAPDAWQSLPPMVPLVLPKRCSVLPRLLFWSLAIVPLTGCTELRATGAVARDLTARHSMGFIVDARPDASFVRESGALYVRTQEGIVHVDLDGRNRRVVFPRAMVLRDQSPDGALLALVHGDSIDLYLGDPTGAVTKVSVPGLDGRASDAVFSPDGRTLAVTRFPDMTAPVAERSKTQDDTLYLIDVATRSVRTIPPLSHDWPMRLSWSLDGSTVWLGLNTLSAP